MPHACRTRGHAVRCGPALDRTPPRPRGAKVGHRLIIAQADAFGCSRSIYDLSGLLAVTHGLILVGAEGRVMFSLRDELICGVQEPQAKLLLSQAGRARREIFRGIFVQYDPFHGKQHRAKRLLAP